MFRRALARASSPDSAIKEAFFSRYDAVCADAGDSLTDKGRHFTATQELIKPQPTLVPIKYAAIAQLPFPLKQIENANRQPLVERAAKTLLTQFCVFANFAHLQKFAKIAAGQRSPFKA